MDKQVHRAALAPKKTGICSSCIGYICNKADSIVSGSARDVDQTFRNPDPGLIYIYIFS